MLIFSGLLIRCFYYIQQDGNSSVEVSEALDARYICTNDLETSFISNTEESISPNDLMSFQWQIACGMVTLSCFLTNIMNSRHHISYNKY